MIIFKIENFKPLYETIKGNEQEWNFDCKDPNSFKAIATSMNGKVKAIYIIDRYHEELLVKDIIKDKELKHYVKDYKCDGNGTIYLSGGSVSNRYGNFRTKQFQNFLDKYNISTVKTFSKPGLSTMHIMGDFPKKTYSIIIPKGSICVISQEYKNTRYKADKEKNKISGDLGVCKVNAPYYLYDINTPKWNNRTLLVQKDINVTSLEKELEVLTK